MKTYNECDIPVNILGTDYVLHICQSSKDKRFEELACDGFCDQSTQELFVTNYIDSKEPISVKDPAYCIRGAIRHEMVHAFLYESGLGSDWEHKQYGQEETTVDWIARQFPNMYETYLIILDKLNEFEVDTDETKNTQSM